MERTNPWETRLRWLVPLAIVALAAFFRLYRLAEVPPAFNFDEAAHAVDAVEILNGDLKVFSDKIGGVEAFVMYLYAAAFALLGREPVVQRLVTAIFAIATIGATYLMVREMFVRELPWRRWWMAALTALGLATSFWHVVYSRIGLEVAILPFFIACSFYFFWRGLHWGRGSDYVFSGLGLGLAAHVYLPGRFLPAVFVLFVVACRCLTELPGDKEGRLLRRPWRGLLIVGVTAFIVYMPLAIHFLLHPADFFGRASATSIFHPSINQGDFWGTLWRSVAGTFGAYGFVGDSNWLANLPGRPILNPVMAGLFWLGVLVAIVKIRRPPYLFTVLAWLVLLVPALITPERSPHYARMMITSPLSYIFPAIGIVTLGCALDGVLHLGCSAWFSFSAAELRYAVGYPEYDVKWQKWGIRGARTLALFGVAALYGWTATSTYHDYFKVWAKSEAHYMSFDGYAVELTEYIMADTDPETMYIMPRDIRSAQYYPHYTIDFLYQGGAPYRYIPMDELGVPRLLTEAARGRTRIKLVDWKMDKHREADPKGYVQVLLEKYGERKGVKSFPAYDVITYQLPASDVDFTSLPDFTALHVRFEERLLLRDSAYGNASGSYLREGTNVPSGGSLWLILRWEKLSEFREDYRTSVIIEDSAGHVVHHTDRDLIHNWHMRTGLWPQNEVVLDPYLVQIPAGTPPGRYALRLAVYSADTMARLRVQDESGGLSTLLGHVDVVVPDAAFDEVWEVRPPRRLKLALADSIGLTGFDLDLEKAYPPGGQAPLVLYWEVGAQPRADYEVKIGLDVGTDVVALQPAQRPLGDHFPTTRWQAGQVWRGFYDLRLPPDVERGAYDLVVQLGEVESGTVVGEGLLGKMQVGGWPRRFEVPDIPEPYNITLGGKIRFLGYESHSAETEAGAELRMTLYWQAVSQMDTSYKVFVHLSDESGQVRSQCDVVPGDGEKPTTGWLSGEVVAVEVRIPLKDVPARLYRLIAGVYDPVTGERLTTQDEQGATDHIVLGQVVVQ